MKIWLFFYLVLSVFFFYIIIDEIKPWENAGSLLTSRAFASSITYEIKFNDTVMYVLGGYQINTGFLDTVEQYDKNTETFEKMDSMTMPEEKSHFCR